MLLKDLQTLATKLATGTLFHVEKAGKAYSVDYSALAKAIIEEYADSTVGGSKQSVQAAIAALNSSLIYGGFGVTPIKSYKLIEHNATLADFTNPGWYRLGSNDFADTMKSAVDGTTFPMTQKDYYVQVIGTNFNNGIVYGILNVYTPRHEFFVMGRIWDSKVYHWEKAPLRSEFDALNSSIGTLSGIKTVVVNDTTNESGIIAVNVGTFTGRPYVLSNISSNLQTPYRITCDGWVASTGTINIRVQKSSDNTAIANTAINDTILVIFSR